MEVTTIPAEEEMEAMGEMLVLEEVEMEAMAVTALLEEELEAQGGVVLLAQAQMVIMGIKDKVKKYEYNKKQIKYGSWSYLYY